MKRATGLERLNLNGTRVTDGVVAHLREMPSLVQAHFGTEEVSPEAQRELSDLLTARAALIAAELRKQPPLSATEQESSYGEK